MEKLKYPHLFSPITIAGTQFRNRIFASPTGYLNCSKNQVLTPEAAAYYERKAIGGAASVSTGELVVDLEYGLGGEDQTSIDTPRNFMPLCRVARDISRHGAVATAELQHTGMYANRALSVLGAESHGEAYGPVSCVVDGREIKAMDEAMIRRTIDKYVQAAVTAKQAGFGMILIHAGHGWLLHQFLSQKINTRTDKWGGEPIENRARLVVTICDEIRRAVGPKMPIEVRFSGSECYEGGYGIEEGIRIAKQLEGHCDLLHVSAGVHEVPDVFAVTHPSMFLGDAPNVKYAVEIKKHVSVPVATVGAFGNNPEEMEELIASGAVDVIEMARSLFADPDLPRKLRRGEDDRVRPCLRCLSCFSSEVACGENYCAVNPECGRDFESAYAAKTARVKKKVLVVGGGIGGMQAALTCGEMGHDVILCEKTGVLGGVILCEKDVSFKKYLETYITRQEAALRRLPNVEIRMNTEVTPEYAALQNADAIIVGVGSEPIIPAIPGIDGKNVLEAVYAYTHQDEIGEKVVILGAGLVGLELAIHLSMQGKSVDVVEMSDAINDGGNFLHALGLNAELKKQGVRVHLRTKAVSIDSDGVTCLSDNGEVTFKGDTVICAVGRRPLRDEAQALRQCAPEFFAIGDCVAARNITAATSEAYAASRDLGNF